MVHPKNTEWYLTEYPTIGLPNITKIKSLNIKGIGTILEKAHFLFQLKHYSVKYRLNCISELKMNDTSVDTPPEVFHTPNLKYFEDVLEIRNIFKTVLFCFNWNEIWGFWRVKNHLNYLKFWLTPFLIHHTKLYIPQHVPWNSKLMVRKYLQKTSNFCFNWNTTAVGTG